MRAIFLIGWLCLSYTLAVPKVSVNSAEDIIAIFKNAYKYYEHAFGKKFMAQRGFSSVEYPQPTITNGQNFDFIIVGGGISGSVIANRLSENPNWNVLLVETGSAPDVLTNIPSTSFLLKFSNVSSQEFRPEPECDMPNTLTFYSGKCLGGSSHTDQMIADRGHPAEYDLLAAMGNKGWSYNEILQYFKASETANVENKNKVRGFEGPVSIETQEHNKLGDIFIKAAESVGYHYGNRNSGHGTVSYCERTTRNGLRSSADKAYLQPILDRPNLTILTNHFVTKINFNKGCNPKATGVTITNLLTKTDLTINANKEVILCAGVFGNPKLLMHSGIGPDYLCDYDIPVVKNLPVGQTFFFPVIFPTIVFKANSNITVDYKEIYNANNLLKLIKTGRGSLTNDNLALDAIIHHRSKEFSGPEPLTDLQIRLEATNHHQTVFDKVHIIGTPIYKEIAEQLKRIDNIFKITLTLHIPESIGHVDIASNNINNPLKITSNVLQACSDKERILQGVRQVQKLAATPIFKSIISEQIFVKIDACKYYKVDSDDYWYCLIDNIHFATTPGAGTCRMGPDDDCQAVVDPDLKVRGVERLRVAGKSILPIPISAYGNLPGYMIAENAAHKIINLWR